MGKKKGNQKAPPENQPPSSQQQAQSQQQDGSKGQPKSKEKQKQKQEQSKTETDTPRQELSAGTSTWVNKQQSSQPKLPHPFESPAQTQRPQSVSQPPVPSAWGPQQKSVQQQAQSQQQDGSKGQPKSKHKQKQKHEQSKTEIDTPRQELSAGTSAWVTKQPKLPHTFESQAQTQRPQSVSQQPVPSAWGPQQKTAQQPQTSMPPQQPVSSAWGSQQKTVQQSQTSRPHVQQPVPSAWGQQQKIEQQPQASRPQSVPFESQPQSSKPQLSTQGSASARHPKRISSQPSEEKSQCAESQQQRQRPDQKRKEITRGDAIEKLSIADSSFSSQSSSSTHSSKQSSGRSPDIPTTALIPLTQNKGSGKNGTKVFVDVNFLALNIDRLLPTVYQYDVTIEPNLPKRMLPHIFEQYRRNNFDHIFIAFDGNKIAVSPQILPITDTIQQQTKVIDENGRERVYMVAMKEARDSEINFNSLKNYTTLRQYDAPLRALQMLEIVLKSPFLNKNGVQAGRSFYMVPSKRIDLGDNYELWTGLYQATVLGSRPYLNVDIAHKAFPAQMNIIDILGNMRIDCRGDLSPRDQNALKTHLNGLMINYSMSGNDASRRSYKFLGLNSNSNSVKFKNDQDQKEYTIVEYFRTRGVDIRFPFLPTLKLGNAIKNITVPMEFCSVAGYQAVNKKCTEMQTRNMIREAATSTDVRKAKIMDMLNKISHNRSQTLQEFGINVGSEFTKVPARILNPPTLQYSGRTVVPAKGQWRIDSLQFLQPQTLTRYAVLILDKYVRDTQVRDFCDLVNHIGRSIGMQIDPNYHTYQLDAFSRNIEKEMNAKMSQMIVDRVELLFCVIPDRGDTYGKVKQCAELDCGILTQCIKSVTLQRKGTDQSTVSNILLKVNAKLNGTNHKLAPNSILPLMKRPFMLIGADVTHPSPGQDHIPSVVGVVSSHDVNGFQYNKCWRLQDPKQEMISDFDEILKEHLDYFKSQRKRLPEVILYFRDGVSEGQFQHVLTIELNAMYRGCQQYEQGYKPKITFIVVQKRHHTRFFPPQNSNLGRDDRKNNNVPPGTIVDNEITHPNESQFYLVSHQSIQGVAKPTKYCILRDDSDYSIDDLQALTYSLCHFFARCTRSVSYPAPTYYAHLAAARGRVYIEGKQINMTKLDKEFKDRTVKREIIKNHPMYFI